MTDLPVTMRGVWLTGHGDMDKLDIRQDIPVPVPGPRDVLVRIAAAGVNNTDINTRVAWYSKNDGASEDASCSTGQGSSRTGLGGDQPGKIGCATRTGCR